MSVLSDLTAALSDGRVDVIDLTAPLSDRTPILQLPPPFANNQPKRRSSDGGSSAGPA